MSVTLSQLRAFTVVSKTLNFGQAALELGVTQPTITKEIQRLERNVGVRLLDRSTRGVTLTSAGEALVIGAEEILERVNTFEVAAVSARRASRRIIRIAASPSIVNQLLPEVLRRADDEELGFALQALEVETGDVLMAVKTGRADIGVGHLIGDSQHVHKRRIGRDEVQAIIHQSLVSRQQGGIQLERLGNLPLLTWPREQSPQYYDFQISVCRERGLQPLTLVGTTRISGSWWYFLEDARAFALAPRDFAKRHSRGVLVAMSLTPKAFVPLEVAWARNASEGVNDLLEILFQVTHDRRANP